MHVFGVTARYSDAVRLMSSLWQAWQVQVAKPVDQALQVSLIGKFILMYSVCVYVPVYVHTYMHICIYTQLI